MRVLYFFNTMHFLVYILSQIYYSNLMIHMTIKQYKIQHRFQVESCIYKNILHEQAVDEHPLWLGQK